MNRWRIAGALWIIGGAFSGFIAFLITDPLTLAVFIVGAAMGFVLGAACLVKPGATLSAVSPVAAVVWVVAFGTVTRLNISNPVEQVASVVAVVVLGGLAGALTVPTRSATV